MAVGVAGVGVPVCGAVGAGDPGGVVGVAVPGIGVLVAVAGVGEVVAVGVTVTLVVLVCKRSKVSEFGAKT